MTRHLPLLVLLAVVLALGFAPGPAREGPFEYKFVRVDQGLMGDGTVQDIPARELGERLANLLAREGWVLDQIDTMWVADLNGQYEALTIVFRRPQR